MLDVDLAEIYGVKTKRLNEQVRRNNRRFPDDFVFQLTAEEKAEVVAKCDHLARLRFSAFLPYAFTEHGAVMLAAVLNSTQAVQASMAIARAFVQLRRIMLSRREFSLRLRELERRVGDHGNEIQQLFSALNDLIERPDPLRRRIGFDPKPPDPPDTS